MSETDSETAQDAPSSQVPVQASLAVSPQPLTLEQLHGALKQLPDSETDDETGLRHTQAEADQLTPEHRQLAILDALTRGVAYRRIAETYRCGTQTLTKLSKRMAALETGALTHLMQLDTLAALDAWRTARSVAAKEGKHGPARDWLTFSRALEQPASDPATGAKVTIIIGQPGRPAGNMTPDVLIAQAVSVDEP